jgi:hypothetical protein
MYSKRGLVPSWHHEYVYPDNCICTHRGFTSKIRLLVCPKAVSAPHFTQYSIFRLILLQWIASISASLACHLGYECPVYFEQPCGRHDFREQAIIRCFCKPILFHMANKVFAYPAVIAVNCYHVRCCLHI